MFTNEELLAADALKSIARDQQIKKYIQQSSDLYPLLLRAANRFVSGETREEGIKKALELSARGYMVSLEYIGENTKTIDDCVYAKNEFLALIKEAGSQLTETTVSLDLSHIGLSVDSDLAYKHIDELAREAKRLNVSIMISMEEAAKTDKILDVYKKVSEYYRNVGITIQAYLERSVTDMKELLHYPGKVRVVKGAYQETEGVTIPRSQNLNERYLHLVDLLVQANHAVSIATHDETLIREMHKRDYLSLPHVEVEMLYGIRPDLLKQLKEDHFKARVYLTYGTEWYLYLCHRLAEYPPNIYVAIADIVNPSDSDQNLY
ncbi:proline dehydrogenase family protein [Paenactinomyces guangxiensis]|uniref:proline dehydrogenase n=1 Tax=Paenactinomyces guangxiensis TaxID=1490290 RepID=A0A7W1WTS4_9BACL|nr:proline dehydrogenase family protein [Paenactinomyces guangxiensis]MBA4495938.1 proline dehydrogenase family protein [Paenactinomyces guangxiensis]MBH8593075.1 proline dehydrogenase family protein [Paenactinomyces guangxiensis]